MDSLFHNGNPEVIHVRLDEWRNAVYAVAIGVGFDHRHDFCWRDLGPDRFEIFFQLRKIDFKICWSHSLILTEMLSTTKVTKEYEGFLMFSLVPFCVLRDENF